MSLLLRYIASSAFLFLCICSCIQASDQEDALIFVAADKNSGFEFPYFLRLPKTLRENTRGFIVVESNNTGLSDDINDHISGTRSQALGNGVGASVAKKLDLPLLIPVLPRSKSDSLVYTHALDRDSLLIDSESDKRLDIQLVKMVDHAQSLLASKNMPVEDKFILVGFSASGTFANRFAFLHPTSLLCVVSGAVNSFPMLPIDKLGGEELGYPLGTSDLSRFRDSKSSDTDWQSLPQLIFMGALDENDALQFDDGYSDEERKQVFQVVGQDMAKRWSKSQSIYLASNANVTFITYGQIGHWTNGRIMRDIVNFIESIIQKSEKEKNSN